MKNSLLDIVNFPSLSLELDLSKILEWATLILSQNSLILRVIKKKSSIVLNQKDDDSLEPEKM